MGAILEGRWDCDACGTKGIRGGERVCPGCARPRPQNVKFYLPRNAEQVSGAAALHEAQAGPDWYCEHCGAGNSALRGACRQCNAARGSSPSHQVTHYNVDQAPRSADGPPEPTAAAATLVHEPAESVPPMATFADLPISPDAAPRPSSRPKIGLPLGVIGALALVALIVFLALRSPYTSVAVSGFAWERSITVERLQTQTEQGWSIPPGGRVITETQAIHHNESILDHYETRQRQVCETVREGTEPEEYEDCRQVQVGTEEFACGYRDLGNGNFEEEWCERPIYERQCTTETRLVPKYVKQCHDETYQHAIYRQEPRYATRYTYEIERWVFGRTAQAQGQDHEATWPALQLTAAEREAGRSESYSVIFTDKRGRAYSYPCAFREWADYRLAQSLKIDVQEAGLVVAR